MGHCKMAHRICGEHCPTENINAATTTKCRNCSKSFHLPCYDVIHSTNKLFVSKNIVFICDACLYDIDSKCSPDRKRKNANANAILKQSTLTTNGKANVTLSQHPPPNAAAATTSTSKKISNEQLNAILSSLSDKMDHQTRLLNELGQNVCKVGNDVVATKNKSADVFNMVQSRFVKRDQQDLRDLAKDTFRPHKQITSQQQTGTPTFGSRRVYSTVVQSKLPVTPVSTTPSSRKRETHISLIDNATGTTVNSAKFPTPKQGKKNVQIGKPVEQRQNAPRKSNPLSKAIWISKFHPETTPDELENYIVENTEVKDTSKFKCSKLVKKDADIGKMSFVSFKIDVSSDVYDILINPDIWPQDKQIREFIKLLPPKQTLGEFMPLNGANASPSSSAQTVRMESETINESTNPNVNSSSSGSGNSSSNNEANGNSTATLSKN